MMNLIKGKQKIMILLCMIVILLFVSCGQNVEQKDEAAASFIDNLEDYGYIADYETMDSGSNCLLCSFCFQGDSLYYIKNMFSPESYTYTSYAFCKRKLEENSSEEILFQIKDPEGVEIHPSACSVFSDERVVLVSAIYQGEQECYMLQLLEPDGEEIYAVNITDELLKDNSSADVMKCVTDADENIYLLSRDQILVYEAEGALLFSLPAKGEQFLNMGTSNNGSVFVTQRIGEEIEVSRINVKERGYSDACRKFERDIRGELLTAGGNTAVLLDDTTGLFIFEPQNQKCTELLKWMDIGAEARVIKEIHMSDSGNVFLLLREITAADDICKLCILTRTLKSEMPSQQVITIGTANCTQLLEYAVTQYNKENLEYQIEIVDYMQGVDTESSEDIWYDAVQKLRMDIITGNAPDIIDFTQVGLDHVQLMEKGFFEDLYSYIDNSEELCRADLVQPVLEAYTTDGKLPCVPTAVYINTLAIKKSAVGDETSWTPDDFIALAGKQPADMQIIEWPTNQSILDICTGYDMDSYIDPITGKCSFDSEEFKRSLEFANSFPEENEESYRTPELLAENKLLMSRGFIADIIDIKRYDADFNGDLVFIGYPSRSGEGISSFTGRNALGITSQSENKEGAWMFIQSLFTEESQTGMYVVGIPVLQSVYDEKVAAVMQKYYDLDEDGNEIEVPGPSGSIFFQGTYAVSEAEAEQFEELMENTHKVLLGPGLEVDKIIREEAAPYFTGQKSVDEVTEIIQNRVQLYINENK